MNFYSELYVGSSIGKKKNKIIRKLKKNAGMLNIYVVTLAAGGSDLFDIISSVYLQQKAVRRNLPMVVGISKGYYEAVDIAARIALEALKHTGEVNVREYLAQKEKEN